jgi:hypothetical protein
MKRAAIAILALGLAGGLMWRKHSAPTHSPASNVSPFTGVSSGSSSTSPSAPTLPTARLAAKPRTLEPTSSDEFYRGLQDKLWDELRHFAADVHLTDEQWTQLQADLLDLASTDGDAWKNALESGDWTGIVQLSNDLERELYYRTKGYMSKQQAGELRLRSPGLVSRTRNAYVAFAAPHS